MARITPPHLEMALSRVKGYVMRHPNGVDAKDLLKVEAYTRLKAKDRKQLLDIIKRYDQLEVTHMGKGTKATVWLRHKIHVLTTPVEPEEKASEEPTVLTFVCCDCLKEKPASEFVGKIHRCTACEARAAAPVVKETKTLSLNIEHKEKETMAPKTNLSPIELRKQAEALLRQAEEAERVSTAKDVFQKQLEPLRRQVLLAHTKVTKGFEAMVDGMAELDKAMSNLRDFKVNS
ncbi:hypothetical protein ICL29_004120 [Salmonella enterica]|nr:hypothetical protein [Salmonella enterica]EHK5999392.1 hypothetical protein [Salmonella enterica]EIF5124611.1 hypothetical protein [Salmonella enterica]EIF5348787.1 hypothetical protein [Salmonella enterica]EIF5657384.1 hypothetical protein [Salmonella enterica]